MMGNSFLSADINHVSRYDLVENNNMQQHAIYLQLAIIKTVCTLSPLDTEWLDQAIQYSH